MKNCQGKVPDYVSKPSRTETAFTNFVFFQTMRIDQHIDYTDELHNEMYALWCFYEFLGLGEEFWFSQYTVNDRGDDWPECREA